MTQCQLQQQRQSSQHWDEKYFKSRGWKLPFRALGYYFYGTEMMHCKTRALLSDFVTANSDRFKTIVMGDDVSNHVQKMQYLSVWGTHVELQATASLFQVPVYMLTFSRLRNRILVGYIWHCYQPCMGLIKVKVPRNRATSHQPFQP